MDLNSGLFPEAVKFTLGNEGLFSDDPDDPGGPTNYGITQQTLSQYRGQNCSVHDVRDLSAGEAVAIYYAFYWCPLSIEGVTKRATALAIFDAAILYGVRKAVWLAQRTLKDCDSVVISIDPKFKVDGYMGPITIKELNRCPERIFLAQFHLHILNHINEIAARNPKLNKFRRGWITRANKILTLTKK